MSAWDWLKSAPYQEEIKDVELIKKKYKYWRIRIFYGMFIGYVFYYFSRSSFNFIMPFLITDLGFSKTDLGTLSSILALTYGLSKFLSGILADRSNPRIFMSVGLILTGFFNILFGSSSTILFFAIFWGLNGWFQGWGWAPCAKLLTHWYSQSERGTFWGFWNISHNLGGFLIPPMAAFLAQSFGWRYAMYACGCISILAGFYILNRLRDIPQSLGLPPIEKFKNDYPTLKHSEERELSTKQILVEYVLSNKYIWLLGISYFFVYTVRMAIYGWIMLFLMEARGFTAFMAAFSAGCFEVGGALGALFSGAMSDKVFGGKRGPTIVIFSIGALAVTLAFLLVPTNFWLVNVMLAFFSGFFIFGPQMLIGVAAAELSHKKAAGTATGFIGWLAYIGSAAAGLPLGKIVENYGWDKFFLVLAVCGVISIVLLIPIWSIKAKETRPEEIFLVEESSGQDK